MRYHARSLFVSGPFLLVIFLFNLTFISANGFAQTTAFSYQGQLNDGGHPASGIYDFTFTLYPSSNAVSSTAGPVTNLAVFTTNGLFYTSVDFGAGVFAANSNYLGIAVRTNGGGAFMALSPRQAIVSAPYAIYAANAATAVSASTSAVASSVSAANVSGVIADAQLTTNIALRAGGNTFSGNQIINSPGRLGVGTNAPKADLHVLGSVNFANALIESSSTVGTWLNLKNSATGGKSWDFVSTGPGNAEGAGHLLFYDPVLNIIRFDIAPNGNTGVGTTNPLADFHVYGTALNHALEVESAAPGGTWLRLTNDLSGRDWDIISTGPVSPEGSGDFAIYNAGTGSDALVVTPNNLVGIGTVSPTANLHVYGNTPNRTFQLESPSTTGTWLRITNGSSGRDWDIVNTGSGNVEGSGVLLIRNANSGSNALAITSGNLIGVGTVGPIADFHIRGSTPFHTLQVESTHSGGTWIRINNNGGGKEWDLISTGTNNSEGPGNLLIHNGVSNANAVTISTNNYVGIGTDSPFDPLTVIGDTWMSGQMTAVNGVTAISDIVTFGNLGAGGNVTAAGNVMVNSTNYAASSQENLRIVRGFVNWDGTIGKGAGFTVTKLGNGVFQINFTRPFSQWPVVTVTPLNNSSAQVTAQLGSITGNNFTVGTFNSAIANNENFSFIAIGN